MRTATRDIMGHFTVSQHELRKGMDARFDQVDVRFDEVHVELEAIKEMLALREDLEKVKRVLIKNGLVKQSDLA